MVAVVVRVKEIYINIIIVPNAKSKTEIETVLNISLLYIKLQKYNFLFLNKIKVN